MKPVARCGTPAGYQRHKRAGVKPCPACAAAMKAYDQRRRTGTKEQQRNRMHARAQTRALTELRQAHPEEYAALYLKHKQRIIDEEGAP